MAKLRHKLLSKKKKKKSCSRPMKLLHYVSQAPHTNICNSIMHKDLQKAAISLSESNSWRRLTTKDHTWLQIWFQTPLWPVNFPGDVQISRAKQKREYNDSVLNVEKAIFTLTIVNGLARRALLRTSCLGLIFREKSGARYYEEI